MLRRTKREVAKELPSRTEVVHLIALSAAEQALYDAAARHARRAFGRRRSSCALGFGEQTTQLDMFD